MIIIKNLTKKYRHHGREFLALNDINLQINKGEIFGVIGKSGAGKSTLLRCVNQLEKPTSGQVFINDENISNFNVAELRQARSKIGMIFQHFNLMQSKNVYDNIALPLKLLQWDKKKIRSRVQELLTLTGLEDHQHQKPRQLSGGQKQRVAIARALANHPQILLCDEATSALDPSATHSILSLLKTINRKLKLTIFLITHEMEVVKSVCDKVAVIHEGKLVEQGSTLQVFTRPQHPITQEFVQHTFCLEIPENMKKALSSRPGKDKGTLIQIAYHGHVADEPIMSKLQQAYRIEVNILQGKIETVQNQTIGHLLVEIQGDQADQQSSIDYLQKHGLTIKTLGYVHRNSIRTH